MERLERLTIACSARSVGVHALACFCSLKAGLQPPNAQTLNALGTDETKSVVVRSANQRLVRGANNDFGQLLIHRSLCAW
jgi:hypothetical protein